MKSKSRMQEETQDFIDDMMEFSCQSMQWCADESEKAAKQVGQVLNHLLADAQRISSMSAEAVALLKEFKDKAAKPSSTAKVSELISGLQALCSEEKAIQDFADPIIETLQFQDRITQMMNNEIRMIAAWAMMRSSVDTSSKLTDEARLQLGQKLLECTTMGAERDLIRQLIPGLPEEKRIEDAQLF